MNLTEMRDIDLKLIQEVQAKLVAKWSEVISPLNESFMAKGAPAMDFDKMRNVAQCLDNAYIHSINEKTSGENIDFAAVQMPIISAIVASTIINDVASVQALSHRAGLIFYADIKKGTTKGGDDTAGDTLIDAETGQASGLSARQYATESVYNESLGSKGSGNVFSATLTSNNVRTGSASVVVSLSNGTVEDILTVTSTNGAVDTLEGETLTGTLTLATGVIAVTGSGSSSTAAVNYRYNYMRSNTSVPEISLKMRRRSIEAIDFPLRAKWDISAAIDLKKAHGVDLEKYLVQTIGSKIKFDIDQRGLSMIEDAAVSTGAATSPGTFAATVTDGESWAFKRYQLNDYIMAAQNNVYAKTLRGKANYMICGLNASRVFKQDPAFKDQSPSVIEGPCLVGTIGSIKVYENPFMNANDVVFGLKGKDIYNTGFIYAPYIPLFSTKTLDLSSLESQKGFMSAAGFQTVNAGFFCKGSVTGLSY